MTNRRQPNDHDLIIVLCEYATPRRLASRLGRARLSRRFPVGAEREARGAAVAQLHAEHLVKLDVVAFET